MKSIIVRLTILFAILSALAFIGAIGFMIAEDLSFFDALYFTVVTISTVGYGDISPTTTVGKVLAILLVVLGVAAFLGVVANATQLLLQIRTERLRTQRIHLLIGLFYSELGNELLYLCVSFDPQIDKLRHEITSDIDSVDVRFSNLERKLKSYRYEIDIDTIDIEKINNLLKSRAEFMLRLLENPSLHEHESFTELLRAIFHLNEELVARGKISSLPDTDVKHLTNDLKRVYPLLVKHWIGYIYYLKANYIYLYSLAVRINPLNPVKSVIVK